MTPYGPRASSQHRHTSTLHIQTKIEDDRMNFE
jgi:hypothetical protein